IAALVGIEVGRLVSGKTGLDIILTPVVTIASGSLAGLLVGPPISSFMTMLGNFVNWGTEQQPFLMGIIVSVIMGIVLTLPISSAALGISLDISGIAAGAAVVGCSAQMVGFAVQSFRENKVSGLISQGVGTSMIQMPNIVRKPIVWLPPIITSAVLGPISTCLFGMTNNAIGAGMGTSGLVGQIMGYTTMTASGVAPWAAILEILLMHVVAPAILTLIISELFRKFGLIKYGDLKLSL
ncbi:MAG: PTS sugar transporter subunit IIC, partial [Oscillospiraceae bacterium]|nr:PTS sugar transporter subunit IIC [Oscillospiraceae bacterium]